MNSFYRGLWHLASIKVRAIQRDEEILKRRKSCRKQKIPQKVKYKGVTDGDRPTEEVLGLAEILAPFSG
ncbi:unnamed protein product [Nezara viridula]|uniref:Uncharacterized protein n=1 Tax=Nezara viridula TaxID=85310 RepID=A0A9P0HDU9_NEZVI|nr:unnamed protein product [Nezara viridula]